MSPLASHDIGHDRRAGAIEAWAVDLGSRHVHTWPAERKARIELMRDLGSVIIDPKNTIAIDDVLDLLRERYPRVRWLIFRKTIATSGADADSAA